MIRLYGQNVPSTINEQSPDNIGALHLTNNPQIYEPQRSNNFELVITGLDGLVRPGTNIVIPNAQEVLRIAVSSSDVPTFAMGVIEIRRGNSSFKVAGTPTFSAGNFTFRDYIGADTVGVLQAWHALAYNVYTEKVGLIEDYKRQAYLIAYTPDHQKVKQWVIEGLWISSLTIPAFNVEEQNSSRLISAQFQYDRAKEDITEWIE